MVSVIAINGSARMENGNTTLVLGYGYGYGYGLNLAVPLIGFTSSIEMVMARVKRNFSGK